MPETDAVLFNGTLEAYINLLTTVTPINLINIKEKRK